jgi:hypothetical protein
LTFMKDVREELLLIEHLKEVASEIMPMHREEQPC